MLETHLSSSITRQRLRTGAAAEYIDAFADWLHLNGYKPTSIDNRLTSLAAWTDWMLTAGFTAHDLLPGFEACKLVVNKEQRVRHSRGPNQQAITAASLFIRFLRLRGELPQPVAGPSTGEKWPILAEFHSWMLTHRGLTETTLDVYQGILVGLLEAVGDDTRAYSPEALRPSSSIERDLTGSIVPKVSSSPSARSCAFSVPLGDVRLAWNMRFLVSPHGASHRFPASSPQRM